MSRHLQDIEVLLDQLIVEHRKLLSYVQQHAPAMKAMNVFDMESLRSQQEACRSRIRSIDQRRRATVGQLMKLHSIAVEPTLAELAKLYPLHAPALLGKRDVLRRLANDVALRANVAAKLAGAVLGHLNTAVRLISSAVQQAGIYTQQGVPKVAGRMGALEAVG